MQSPKMMSRWLEGGKAGVAALICWGCCNRSTTDWVGENDRNVFSYGSVSLKSTLQVAPGLLLSRSSEGESVLCLSPSSRWWPAVLGLEAPHCLHLYLAFFPLCLRPNFAVCMRTPVPG